MLCLTRDLRWGRTGETFGDGQRAQRQPAAGRDGEDAEAPRARRVAPLVDQRGLAGERQAGILAEQPEHDRQPPGYLPPAAEIRPTITQQIAGRASHSRLGRPLYWPLPQPCGKRSWQCSSDSCHGR